MSVMTVQDRVAQGAAWLDIRYPGWFNGIDLSILDLADCHQCVLGQVYTGCIPTEERNQLLAQVVTGHAKKTGRSVHYWAEAISYWGGYNVLHDFHELPRGGRDHGFHADVQYDEDTLDYYKASEADYAALLDEWTKVIIERRLAQHPDVLALTVRLDELREPVAA